MELKARDALLVTGTAFFAGMFYFYRQKNTVAFKVCYGLMWPTLGGGIMLAVQPDDEQLRQAMERSGVLTQEELQKRREANAASRGVMQQFVRGQQPPPQ